MTLLICRGLGRVGLPTVGSSTPSAYADRAVRSRLTPVLPQSGWAWLFPVPSMLRNVAGTHRSSNRSSPGRVLRRQAMGRLFLVRDMTQLPLLFGRTTRARATAARATPVGRRRAQ